MPLPDRATARLVGWLFIGTFVFSIPGLLLYGPLLDHPDYVLGAGHDNQIAFAALLEVLLAICNAGTAIALYPLARRYTPRAAIGYVASRGLESTVIVVGIVSVLSVVTLRQTYAGTGTDHETLVIAGRSLVAIHDWTFLLGPGFCAAIGNGLILGYLMYTSGLLPRRLPAFGLTAGGFAFVAAAGALLGAWELQSQTQALLTIPEIIWEATFGIYLVVKGFTAPERRRTVETKRVATAALA